MAISSVTTGASDAGIVMFLPRFARPRSVRNHPAHWSGQQRERLRLGLEQLLRSRGIPPITNGEGAVFHLFFQERRPGTYRETSAVDKALYSDFALALLDEGIFVLPDCRWHLSATHTDKEIDATLSAVERILS